MPTAEVPRASREVLVGPHALPGRLDVLHAPRALVLFAHGSGSGRTSPRNRLVARRFQAAHLATLRFDLLSEAEAQDRSRTFDIPLLASRLDEALDWLRAQPDVGALRCGLYGASTGAAAALVLAAERPRDVRAVVSRGGRPDLAREALPRVQAPTLLIVGGADAEVLALNRTALEAIGCEKRLEIVAGATHLFSEPGALEEVAGLASLWFRRHLVETIHAD